MIRAEQRGGDIPGQHLKPARLEPIVDREPSWSPSDSESRFAIRSTLVEIQGDTTTASASGQPGWTAMRRLLKRGIDISISVFGLLVVVVTSPVLALLIWLDDGGPILYSQERTGFRGRTFRLWKFRTMERDAETESGPRWAGVRDPRTTRVGSFLRATHLDELPQFWNVLRGDMSLVGPRPERPGFVGELAEVIPQYERRLAVRPGITGPAQLQLGYVNSIEGTFAKFDLDLHYIGHSSLRTDLHCILRTVWLTAWDLVRVTFRLLRGRGVETEAELLELAGDISDASGRDSETL